MTVHDSSKEVTKDQNSSTESSTSQITPEESPMAYHVEDVSANDKKEPSSSTDETKESVPTGSLSSYTTLYAGPEDDEGRFTWHDKLPEHIKPAAENEDTARHALIVRKKQSYDSRRSLDIHSLIIQSPWLKRALGMILKDYPGVTCELDRLEFEAPFEPFVHRWSDILKFKDELSKGSIAQDSEYDTEDDIVKTKEHFGLLYDVLHAELKDTIRALLDFLEQGVTTYKYMWTIFQPGHVVLSDHSGTLSAYEFESGFYTRTDCGNAYKLRLDHVIWDGARFGRQTSSLYIYEYRGTKDVASLDCYPLAFYPEREELQKRLIERGKRVEQLAGYHYEAYDGTAISWDKEGKPVRVTTSGRIIIDTGAFNRFSPFYPVYTSSLKETDEVFVESESTATSITKNSSTSGPTTLIVNPSKARARLGSSLHLISSPLVRGYSLKAKEWLAFFVDLVTPIKRNENAFSSLVLPPDQKDLIMSFAETQSSGISFDDIIAGKGKGIIMLLSGPPGVGKTLTAESVAEQMRVPLYALSAGDLGLAPSEIEEALNGVIDMVTKWNAVLLLDECDIFLEARSTHDLERNKVVSVFLRALEYYEGIFVLTTNRIDNIDPAFQSRIHVSMAYSDLDQAARKKVWENFLKQLPGGRHELSDADLEELSKVVLNGRQIKNVLKTSQLLVTKKGGLLRKEIVKTVLAIEKGSPSVGSWGEGRVVGS